MWGCFSADGVWGLVRITGLLNADKYRKILNHTHAVPSGRHLIAPNVFCSMMTSNTERKSLRIIFRARSLGTDGMATEEL